MIFDRHANLKYKYGNRHFWCRGFYVDTVGRNKKVIEEYIKKQLQEDIMSDQISIKEYVDPFTGEPQEKTRKSKTALAVVCERTCGWRTYSMGLKARPAPCPYRAEVKPPA